MFHTIDPSLFPNDRPTVIFAGGPSLVGFNPSRLAAFHVLAVKASVFDMPCVAGFGLDYVRYKEWRQAGKFSFARAPVYWAFSDEHHNREGSVFPARVLPIRRTLDNERLSDNPSEICSGASSGFGALNLAYLGGAKRIILLGYDYGAIGGVVHHNERHYLQKRQTDDKNWRAWATYFDYTLSQLRSKGVKVINASPHSRITAFPRMTIDEALNYNWV